MNVHDEIKALETRLAALKWRVKLEGVLRGSVDRRICQRCNLNKPQSDFPVIASGAPYGGLRVRFHSWCKKCRSERTKEKRLLKLRAQAEGIRAWKAWNQQA